MQLEEYWNLKEANEFSNNLSRLKMALPNGKSKNWLSVEESQEIETETFKRFGVIIGNKERAKIELYEFIHEPPQKYTCYLSKSKAGKIMITNWTGKFFAYARINKTFRDNFGGERITFSTSKAINGFRYYGTGFCGLGGYCTIKAYKSN